jgi:hypothetical protein
MWCGKDDTTGEKISGMCEDCKTKQSETLPEKLARMIRDNPGSKFSVLSNRTTRYTVNEELDVVIEGHLTDVFIVNGSIVITIGTP